MKRLLVLAVLLLIPIALASPASAATVERASTPCAQWKSTAMAAGFTSAQWPTVARIMFRESRCRPTAHNRSGAHGLMQIMPMWRRKPGCGDISSGAGNLRCARVILRTQGWRAWAQTY